MAKNIIICCDGTSNDFSNSPSNVVKLFSVLRRDPATQVVYYDPGVGTPSTYDSFNPITKKLKYGMGQGFGYGLSDNIMEAYKFLMQTYEEGDRMYFFGFSRGAYTVRALAGLINTCGLLYPNSQNLVPEAMRIYNDRANTVSLSNNGGSYYERDNMPPRDSIAGKFKSVFGRRCDIHFLGLWDTVSSVGWVYNPVTLQATANNIDVVNVRHAVSIDERRAFFKQNLWGARYRKMQDVKQVWFPGDHSDVGGAHPDPETALGNISLEWMLLEAHEKGLLIDADRGREIVNRFPDPHLAPQHTELKGFWLGAEVLPKIIRVNKGTEEKSRWVSRVHFNLGEWRYLETQNKNLLHESTLMRMRQLEQYRPKNILSVCGHVDALEEHFEVEKWKKL